MPRAGPRPDPAPDPGPVLQALLNTGTDPSMFKIAYRSLHMTKTTIRETLTGIGAALVTSAVLCIAVDLFRAGLVLSLLGCAFACPVKHRLSVGVAGVFAALVLIVAWATAMTPDREFAATYLSVFVIFMVGTGLSRAARCCEDSSCT